MFSYLPAAQHDRMAAGIHRQVVMVWVADSRSSGEQVVACHTMRFPLIGQNRSISLLGLYPYLGSILTEELQTHSNANVTVRGTPCIIVTEFSS